MSFISVFDVLGPNMIGPSSSHTAGTAVIAYLAQKMINGPLKKVEFTLYGSFAKTYRGHGTDRALLSSQTELFVYPNKYIKSLLFLKKTLAFLYFMVYTKKACDIDSYEA